MEEYQQLSIFDVMYENYKIQKPIRLIELFAGIGSQAKALKNIGANFETYKVVEFDKYAIASYNAIHNTNFTTLDITKISGKDLEIKETNKYEYIMTYSFPCTDLSIAGSMQGMEKGSGTRSGLLWEVERLLNECKELPQILLMENVPQVHSKDNISDFNKWINFLENKGYKNYWKDLNAKNYEIPHNRNRTFMISILGDYNYVFPKKCRNKFRLKHFQENSEDVNVKHFISKKKYEYLVKKIKEGWKKKIVTDTDDYATCICNPSKNQINDTYIYDIPVCLNSKGGRGGIDGIQPSLQDRVYDNNGVAVALTTSFHPLYIDKDGKGIRRLTPKECFRLMGFNDEDYEKASKVNSEAQLYKQAGNSIVVNVLMAIFKQLF